MIARNTMMRYAIHLSTLVVAATVLIGCGSEVNQDFSGFGDGAYHPFETSADHSSWLAAHGDSVNTCRDCHGAELRGVDVGLDANVRSCFECHSAANHFENYEGAAQNTHQAYLKDQNWDMTGCTKCHVLDAATTSDKFASSCTQCHVSTGGPFACNTCHGNFAGDATIAANWAPPRGLDNQTGISDPSVGAHQAHLNAPDGLFAKVECSTCHNVPSSYGDSGHLDGDNHAEVVFSGPASARGHTPVYDPSTQSCSNTACHLNSTPIWTNPEGQIGCMTCHGIPPVDGNGNVVAPHNTSMDIFSCTACHGSVIDPNGRLYNPDLHANGQVNGNN